MAFGHKLFTAVSVLVPLGVFSCSVDDNEVNMAATSVGGATGNQTGTTRTAGGTRPAAGSAGGAESATGGTNATGGSSVVSGSGSAQATSTADTSTSNGTVGSGGSSTSGGTSGTAGNSSSVSGSGGTSAITNSSTSGGTVSSGGAANYGGTTGSGGATVLCGDGICDASENPSNCCRDCGCSSGSVCELATNACVTPKAITAGGYHTCLLIEGGVVKCWGDNSHGQLGSGASDMFGQANPTTVAGLTNVKAVAAGSTFTCAVVQDGRVKCWGDNSSGQLGNGTRTASNTPIDVSNVVNATSVAAGYDFACAVMDDGTVACWGGNVTGQLGNGTTTGSLTAVTVSNLTNATKVTAGYGFACALLSDGTAKCWGENADGQLGTGTGTNSLTPVPVNNLSGATALAAMCDEVPDPSLPSSMVNGSVCALIGDGTVKCWGSNWLGELGTGNGPGSTLRPNLVKDVVGASSIAAGYMFACAVITNGAVRCWGNNTAGQLGDGTNTRASTPVTVFELTGASQVAAGTRHACALMSNGAVNCWGSNVRMELGNEVFRDSSSRPYPVSAFGTPQGGGGTTSVGGATSTGGSFGSGGSDAAGGTVSAGGSTASGGAHTTGGLPSTGGSAATGGRTAGGTTGTATSEPVGGVSATGGLAAIGGEYSTGGTIAAGGVASAGGTSVVGGLTSTGGASSSNPDPCALEGATECLTTRRLRSCLNGSWVEVKCDPDKFCSEGSCHTGCNDLVAPPDASIACYMPVDPNGVYVNGTGIYHGAAITVAGMSTDPVALPVDDVVGAAFDTLDQTSGAYEICASVASNAAGLFWQTAAPTRYFGRLYLWGYIGLKNYVAKYGRVPAGITLHVKSRKIDNSAAHVPVPAFSLYNGDFDQITSLEDDSSQLGPTSEWTIKSRPFAADEISALYIDGSANYWELDYISTMLGSVPPENVQVAWFALTFTPPSSGPQP